MAEVVRCISTIPLLPYQMFKEAEFSSLLGPTF